MTQESMDHRGPVCRDFRYPLPKDESRMDTSRSAVDDHAIDTFKAARHLMRPNLPGRGRGFGSELDERTDQLTGFATPPRVRILGCGYARW